MADGNTGTYKKLIFLIITHILSATATLNLTLTATIVLEPSEVVSKDGHFHLLILHNNDMHARFEETSQKSGTCKSEDKEKNKCYGGFSRIAHVVKEARRAAATGQGPPVLFLNAGDTYTGTAWFTIYKWKIAADFINALQPDAISLGNHEFDRGVSGLIPFIRNVKCPVLSSNLDLTAVPELAAETNLMKSFTFNVNGTKVGVIGYLTPTTKEEAVKNDVEYYEEVTSITIEAARLKNEGVNILIALGHSGLSKDMEIAKRVENIDLVVGGHSHTLLWGGTPPDIEIPEGPYPILVTQHSGKIVPVVQMYCFTKYFGRLHVLFNSQGDIVKYDANPILLDASVPQDPEVLSLVDYYKAGVLKETETVLGQTTTMLDLNICMGGECALGNFITDAVVFKNAQEYEGKGWTDAPVAIIQNGGIRGPISHASITKGDLMTVLPFGGKLVKLQVKGSTILEMLEHAVSTFDLNNFDKKFLQMSGMQVAYDCSNPPGKRVIEVFIICGVCDEAVYSPVNTSETYSILISLYLYGGGNGYTMFKEFPAAILDYDELDAVIEYLRYYSPVHPEVENRITLNNCENKSNKKFVREDSIHITGQVQMIN